MQATAGYSGTPLARKLGIKPGMRVLFDGAPEGFADWVAPLPEPLELLQRLADRLDCVVTFHTSGASLRRRVPQLLARLDRAGMIWVAWPKRSSGVATDIREDDIRAWFLPGGELVDVKVCAISDVWSGLKLVIRKEKR